MQQRLEQLATSTDLQPAYLLAGNEPFQQITALDKLRQRAREAGFDERQVFDFSDGKTDWPGLLEASQSMGLFSSRQLIELRLGEKRPDKKGGDILQAALAQAGGDLLFLISCSQLNRKKDESKAWYKAIDKVGVVVKIWPVDHKALPNKAQQFLQQEGLSADTDAVQLLAQRSEGNLLALSQEIQKLALLYPNTPLTLKHIQHSVADSSHYSIFDLGSAITDGNAARALHILDHLQEIGEADTLILWHLSRDLHAMEAASCGQQAGVYLPRPRLNALNAHANRLSTGKLQRLLRLAHQCDKQIKGQAKGNAADSLSELVVGMTGATLALGSEC